MAKQIFTDLQKFKCYSLWSKLPTKIKRPEYFAENHDMEKIKFLKTIHRKELYRKETYDIDLRLHIYHSTLSLWILSIQSNVGDSQVDPNSIQGSVNCSKWMVLQSFHCLEWSILLTAVVYLMTDNVLFLPLSLLLNDFVTSVCKWSYSFS